MKRTIFVIAQVTTNKKYNNELGKYINKLKEEGCCVFVPDLNLNNGLSSKDYYTEIKNNMEKASEIHTFFLKESTDVGVMFGMALGMNLPIQHNLPLQSSLIQSISNYIIENNN